jgi:hypothetical protein
MTAESAQLLAQAHRRACSITSACNADLRRALVARVLFDLRAALTQKKETTR